MKVTGIVRRIDDLGRIVIPREFRKAHNIHLGDPMEISCNINGEIIIKKVERTLELIEIAKPYLEVLSSQTHSLVMISNNDEWITGDGEGKNEFIGRKIPQEIGDILNLRGSYNGIINPKLGYNLANSIYDYVAIVPIVGDSECLGGMYAFSKSPISDETLIILKVCSLVLGNNMQKY